MNEEILRPTLAKRTLRGGHLKSRYAVDPRTITRWKKDGTLPPPDLTINGIDYWFEETIERNERENFRARRKPQTETSA